MNRRGLLNADPALDLGAVCVALDPPLRSALTVPLCHGGRVVGVLCCYAADAQAFTEDHMRVVELLATSLGAAVAAVKTTTAAESGNATPSARRVGGSNVLVMTR